MIRLVAILLVGAVLSAPGLAQESVVRLVVAFPPGGPVDLVARTIAEELGKQLNQRVIVDNKPGANGVIAAQNVAHAIPDGTTLWLTSVGAAAINPVLYDKLPYDMQRDFTPVSLVVDNDELLVVNPGNPAKTTTELIANAKKAQKPVAFASSGVGSIPHLAMEQLADVSKTNLLHVPYKGAAPAITDVMGGQVDAFFGDVPGLVAHIQGGKLRAIGIAAPRRHPLFPDLPTLAEQGLPGVDSNNWYAIFAPANMPGQKAAVVNQAIRRTLATPAVRDKLVGSGAVPAPSSPEELASLLKRDTEKWGRLIKEKGIKPE